MRKEWLARILIALLLAAAVGIPAFAAWQRTQEVVIHARMAETGGWTPGNLSAEVGQPLHLRLTSDDVIHSFAVGQSDQPAVDVKPGEISEITLVFDWPGKYTFYCTRWCSVNHWRMRGTIEVSGPEQPASTAKQPLYLTLGLDIDGEHHAEVVPGRTPSAARGEILITSHSLAPMLAEYQAPEYYQAHSPVELWKSLRSAAALQKLADQELWDLTAWIWQSNASAPMRQEGARLYAANCAACHGEQGAGDGPFAAELDKSETGAHDEIPAGVSPVGESTVRPAAFTDPEHLLAASPAHLQGKILRGGMGTGMPYWGPIFTEDQTWALVAYLWTFQFQMEQKP